MQGVNPDSILALPHTPPPEKKLQEAFWKLGDLNVDQLLGNTGITTNFLQYDNSNVVMQKNSFIF